jgi:5,10-methylenetetrahydromethanopterin reductase
VFINAGFTINQVPGVPLAAMVELAREAERLGYDRCWVSDQGLDCRDVFVTLAAVADKTRSLRLGTGITHPYTRHPAVTAAAILSLDELSGGRAFLGIGAGGTDTLLPLGIERRRPLTAVREMIQLTRALNQGRAVDFHGEVFQLRGARLDHARPGIEIWLAGRGRKMITLGGELADGVLLDFIHKDLLLEHVSRVRAGAAATGNSPRICYGTTIVTDDRAFEAVRPLMFWRLADAPPDLQSRLGVTSADIAAMRQVVAAQGMPAVGRMIKDDWVRPFVIMGSVSECAAELTRLVTQLGIDEFVLPILDMASAPDLLAQVAQVLAGVRNGIKASG